MSKRVKNTTTSKGWGNYKAPRCKPSNNAMRNRVINGGTTVAQGFYLYWSY